MLANHLGDLGFDPNTTKEAILKAAGGGYWVASLSKHPLQHLQIGTGILVKRSPALKVQSL